MDTTTILILVILLGGWGGMGWYGYGTGPCANPNGCPGPTYGGGGLVHLLLVIALVVILLRFLHVR